MIAVRYLLMSASPARRHIRTYAVYVRPNRRQPFDENTV
jgi:hypothetical protein